MKVTIEVLNRRNINQRLTFVCEGELCRIQSALTEIIMHILSDRNINKKGVSIDISIKELKEKYSLITDFNSIDEVKSYFLDNQKFKELNIFCK